MRIAKLGVVGAGTMGSGIAALAASAGIPVVLLDIPGTDGDRNAPREGGPRARARRRDPPRSWTSPAPRSSRIGNIDDDLELLARLRPGPRGDHRAARAEAGAVRAARAAAASRRRSSRRNTSGIPMQHAHRGTQRPVPAALPRHALLQSAALSAPARDHPDAETRAARRSTRRAGSASACSARGSSSRRTSRASSPTGSACTAWSLAMNGLMESRPHDRRSGRAHRTAARPREARDLPHRRHHRARRARCTSSKGLSASTGEDFSMPDVGARARRRAAGSATRRGARLLQEGRQGHHDARLEDAASTGRSRRSRTRRSAR